jgi:hypothetical protein
MLPFFTSVFFVDTVDTPLTQFVSSNCGDFVLGLVPETSVQSGFRYGISGDHITSLHP